MVRIAVATMLAVTVLLGGGAGPVWAAPGNSRARPPETLLVRRAQAALARLGYPVGEPDGRMGPQTGRALAAWARGTGLPWAGGLNERLVARLEAAAPPPSQGGVAPAESRRVALVIGNAAYALQPPLLNPGRDAEAVAAVLARLGFRVILRRDAGRLAMEEALDEFHEAATRPT